MASMQSRLDAAFSAATDAKKVPGIAAIAMDRSGAVLFKGAYGDTNTSDPTSSVKMSGDTPVMIWSCTKLFTSVAALQLVEQGKLNLDDPVEKYVPKIAKIQVLEGFDSDVKPQLRPPKTKITVLHLMTHTAGFTYDFFNADTARYTQSLGGELSTYATEEAYNTPLAFDPGDRFEYGINTDWLGFVIEAITDTPLDDYITTNILDPLGLKNTGVLPPTTTPRLLIHHRSPDSNLTANPTIGTPSTPPQRNGGSYLSSTLTDFSAFLLTLLNNGAHPRTGARILREASVKEYLFSDHIHKICSGKGVGVIRACNPVLSNDGELLPGLEKGWSCGLMLNARASPKGRGAGSASWAGLGNLYYFIDPQAGRLGVTMSGVLPFLDAEVCRLHDELERAVYGHEAAEGLGEVGGNWRGAVS